MRFDTAYFDAGIRRIGTECEKWDGMIEETGDADMLPMWVADMDFPSAPAIAKALEGVLSWGTWGYTIAGEKDAAALCAYWARRHGVQFSPDAVLMSPCVVTGMRVALRALTKEGDGVLIPQGEGRTELYCHSALTGITCDAMGLWDFSRADYAAA